MVTVSQSVITRIQTRDDMVTNKVKPHEACTAVLLLHLLKSETYKETIKEKSTILVQLYYLQDLEEQKRTKYKINGCTRTRSGRGRYGVRGSRGYGVRGGTGIGGFGVPYSYEYGVRGGTYGVRVQGLAEVGVVRVGVGTSRYSKSTSTVQGLAGSGNVLRVKEKDTAKSRIAEVILVRVTSTRTRTVYFTVYFIRVQYRYCTVQG